MRDIKFRAWMPRDQYEEEPVYEMNYYLAFEDYEPINDLLGSVEHLMQYTGLKDKTGVDIFEGDIIKYAYRDYTVVVKPLERGRYSAFWDFSDFLDPSDNELGAEVIGNIYENPELLGDEK